MSDERDGALRGGRTARVRALLGGLLAVTTAFGVVAGAAPARAANASPNPGVALSVDPTAPPSPSPTPAPTPIVTSVNLYRAGAAVHQYTIYWCVPASTQTMLNVILNNRQVDTTRLLQTALARVIGTQNRYRYTVPGNDIRGWAKALNANIPAASGVRYRDRAFRTRTAALWEIVRSIDRTGFPVGITVWHGTHAWTVMGYRVSQMPGQPSTRAILGFYVTGPLATSRHHDPWPVKFMALATFDQNFTWYDEDHQRPPWHRAYVLVRPEPVLSTPAW